MCFNMHVSKKKCIVNTQILNENAENFQMVIKGHNIIIYILSYSHDLRK